MKRKKPLPKSFDVKKHQAIVDGLTENMSELEFEKAYEEIAFDILLNYEGFEKVEPGPDLKGRPFDFLGFKNGKPYIIELKGSLRSFHAPGEVQKRRMQEVLEAVEGLNIALLQIKLKEGKYRIFYNKEMDILFAGRQVPIRPVIDWVKSAIMIHQ